MYTGKDTVMKTGSPKNSGRRKNHAIDGLIGQSHPDLYRLVVDNMYDSLYILDTEGRFTFVNDGVVRRSGYPMEFFIGKSCFDMIRPVDKGAVQKGFETVMQGKPVPSFELSYTIASGETAWIEINATPLVENNQVVAILVISRNITERKQAEEELRLYRNQLEELVLTRTEELVAANEELQREINEHKKTEEALRSSELYYRTIFQNTGTAMVIMEEDTTISLVNAESIKFVGYTPSALENKRKAIDFVRKNDLERILEYQKIRSKDPAKAPRSYELQIVDREGRTRDVFVTIVTIPGTKKSIGSFLDITERKRVEVALKASEEKYRHIFENATEGIFQMTLSGSLISSNPAFARLFGYQSPEKAVRSIRDMPHEIFANPAGQLHATELLEKHGQIRNYEIQCRRKDGKNIWISTNVRAVTGDSGKRLFYEGTLIDITERKRMQEDLENKSRSLEETNAALRVLLKHREEAKSELEERILYNVRELVLPYVERLKDNRGNNDRVIVDIVDTNLNDILSPFVKSVALKFGNLTPKEIQVADLIKKGKTTKEMSQILNLSARTIDIHRYNIRRKLNLNNKHINLQSHLLSLS